MNIVKVVNARNVLKEFFDDKNISTHLLYLMTKFIAVTETESEFYMAELRKIVNKYAKIEDGKEEAIIPAENIEDFNKEVSELNETPIPDPGIRFNLSEISDNLKLSMKQMQHLFDFIDETE